MIVAAVGLLIGVILFRTGVLVPTIAKAPSTTIATLVPPTPMLQTTPTTVAAVASSENTTPSSGISTQPLPTKGAQGVLFEDDFNDDLDAAWEIVKGDWRAANGTLTTISRNGEWSAMLVGSDEWTDYVVEVEFDGSTNVNQYSRILVRAQDYDNYMAFGTVAFNNNPEWRLWKDGESSLLLQGNYPQDKQQKLRIEVKGDLYTAYKDGAKYLSINDSTFGKGKVGVAMYCQSDSNCNTFDNFKVTALE